MEKLQKAIGSAGLGDQIKVSTVVSTGVVSQPYPPSTGSFSSAYEPITKPLIGFLVGNEYPLLVNLHPYFAYIGNLKYISLDYAKFRSKSVMVRDGDLGYQNFLTPFWTPFIRLLRRLGESRWKSWFRSPVGVEHRQNKF
ncbi:Glycoside hydrolase [Parasponia andersonii]|uniref:glucan endo-1,3-beta-D-glucosidase n=1 Tax=Parasponia andersonii TaxID=3476 RepID=A0A2P5A850_PARAD|nr:Glycoside hydrolase [Parasponia andersonii]